MLYNIGVNKLIKEKLKILFSNLCCSYCKNEFDENSIEITRMENGLLVCRLTCKYCGKNFGAAFIGISNLEVKSTPLEVKDGPDPITYDDVIDAHEFIKNLDEHWHEYLPHKN